MRKKLARIIKRIFGIRKARPHSLYRPCPFAPQHRPCRMASGGECTDTASRQVGCPPKSPEIQRAIELALAQENFRMIQETYD